MFAFVLSSRRSWLRALPQDLLTRSFCVWFCTKNLCFAFKEQGMTYWPSPHITGHGLRPPASDFVPSAMYIAGRHSLLPVGHLFCQNGNFEWPITVHLFLVDIWHPPFLSSIHVYGGISLLLSLFGKLCKSDLL